MAVAPDDILGEEKTLRSESGVDGSKQMLELDDVVQRVVRHDRAIDRIRLPSVKVADLRKDFLSQAVLPDAVLGAFDQDRRELQAIDAKPGRAAGAQRICDTDLDAGVAGANAEHAANGGSLEALQHETG